jgi:hypothetical protein
MRIDRMPRGAFSFAIRISCITALCLFESAYAQDGRTAGAIEEEFNRSVVRILVSGRNAMGNDAGTTYGTGIFIDDGVILTAGHVVGRDEDWYSSGGRPDRHVDVVRLNESGNEEKLAIDVPVRRAPSDVDLALIFLNSAGTTGWSAGTLTIRSGGGDDAPSRVPGAKKSEPRFLEGGSRGVVH